MYARQIGDRVLTFGVSGMLFRDALVMYDRDTDTLWTQVNGLGIKGPLAGQTLETVPSILATWKQWKQLYPESQVLKKRGPPGSAYAAYNRDQNRIGIMGRRLRDKRLPNKERIIGVRAGDAATAFAEKDVRQARLVHADVGTLPVVLVSPTPDHPIVIFDRRAGGRLLSFRLVDGEPTLVEDAQTRSRWSLADGRAVSGPLEGTRLERAPAYPAFWFGWLGYFPATEVWKAAGTP
ncbi:MAG: DUF3179 domain-containing protein [Acidobacteria bacterium]|nr:DUF3179 domain-containing protein [Acidobacteriota bacterium]